MIRTFASSEQTARLGWKLYLDGIRSSKEVLEPRQYRINNVNYDYRQVDVVIEALKLVDSAIRAGTLKASKTNGLQIVKGSKA